MSFHPPTLADQIGPPSTQQCPSASLVNELAEAGDDHVCCRAPSYATGAWNVVP